MAYSVALGVLFPSATAQSAAPRDPVPPRELKEFLQDFAREFANDRSKDTRYSFAVVDLSARNSAEVIVYLDGRAWCGSGGCELLVLSPKGSSFKVLSKITMSRPPIRVLETRTKGWRDLSVWVQGGGIQPGYQAKLPFDGSRYAENPSVPPAQPARSGVPAKTVITSTAIKNILFP